MLGTGGSCVLLGVPKLGTEASFVVGNLYNDKSILGCRYGQASRTTTCRSSRASTWTDLHARRDGQPDLRPR